MQGGGDVALQRAADGPCLVRPAALDPRLRGDERKSLIPTPLPDDFDQSFALRSGEFDYKRQSSPTCG